MKKGASRKGVSIADRKTASTSSASKNDEATVEVKVESKPAVEEENEEEEAKVIHEEEKEEAKRDSETHQEKEENASQNDEAKCASSSQIRRGKRNRATKNETEKKRDNIPSPRAKRARTATTKPKEAEPEYFKKKRSLEDLWKAAFPWDQLDALHEFNWDFRNVEEALEEGGRLYGKRVYVFSYTESQLAPYENENRAVLVPAVVCIESSIPPFDKIGVASVQGEVVKIIPMKEIKMAWVPYVPLEERSALKNLNEDRPDGIIYPYIDNPFKEDESERSTVVPITFPFQRLVVCEYDRAKNNIEEFTDNLIKEEALVRGQKDEFMEFVKEQCDKTNEEAKQAREKRKEELSEETKKAYKEMKLYKFYPLPSTDTPDIKKSPFINRYVGNAHEVF